MFEDPAPLRFRTLDILRRLTKDILEGLSKEEAYIQKNTGASLVIKTFETESIITGSQPKNNKKIKVSNACERCRKRKTGCDGYMPCETCMKQKHECRYAPGVTAPTRPPLPPLPTPIEPSPSATPPTQQPFYMDRFVGARTTNYFSPQPTPMLTETSQHDLHTDSLGHFIGETSFFATHARPAPLPAAHVAFPHLTIPSLSFDTQVALIDTFCSRADAFFPCVMDRANVLAELEKCSTGQPSSLSPLFFCALFSRATSLVSQVALSDQLLNIALRHRDDYYDLPHFSTVLALVIMANQLEHKKLRKNLTRAWLLIGEAVRLAVDMGLHRSFRVLAEGEDHTQAQWCIRTFWSLLVTERTMSLTYGRPSILDEKDIDLPVPKTLAGDDDHTMNWIESLRYLTVMSNIAGKIMRYNYSVHIQLPGAFKTNATMSTVDTWLSSECSVLEDCLSHAFDGNEPKKRLNALDSLYYMLNLLQAHRPFISQEGGVKAQSVRPSFEICFLTVVIISHLAHTTPLQDLVDLSLSPPTLEVMVMGLHIHLYNASAPESDRRTVIFSEICFERIMNRLEQLPIIADNTGSMVSDTLGYLRQKYYQRPNPIVSGYSAVTHPHLHSDPHPSHPHPQQQLPPPHQPQVDNVSTLASTEYTESTKASLQQQQQSPAQSLTFIEFQSKSSGRPSQQGKRKLTPQSQALPDPILMPTTPTPTMVIEPAPVPTTAAAIPMATAVTTTVETPGTCLALYNQSEYFFPVPEGDPDLPSSILLNNDFHYF